MGEMTSNGRSLVFLLRLWRESGATPAIWRCSLEDPATRDRRGFDGVESLASFLTDVCTDTEPGEPISAGAAARASGA